MSIVERGGRLAYGKWPDDWSAATESPSSDACWYKLAPNTYAFKVYLLAEDNGFSIWMADLPGVASQGDTLAEALENLKEAFLGAFEVYQEDGMDLPWLPKPKEKPINAMERWILVNA